MISSPDPFFAKYVTFQMPIFFPATIWSQRLFFISILTQGARKYKLNALLLRYSNLCFVFRIASVLVFRILAVIN